MSDESPRDESPAKDPPVDETVAAGEHAAAAEGPPAAPPPPPGEPPARQGFYVPRWAAVVAVAVVSVLVLFGGGFAVGHVTAGDGGNEDRERIELEFPGRNGDGSEEPGLPWPSSGVFLGVTTRDATGDAQGAEIVNVAEDSPAAQAGLQDGDIVTAVNGESVSDPADLAEHVRDHEPGDNVTITYTREGNSAEAQVELADRFADSTPN
jgi:membrane-associated protease RseP (regulator of RpoE activity)